MLRYAPLSLVVLLVISVGGCSGKKEDYKYRVAVIPKGLTHEFWQSIERGAKRAGADLQQQGLAVQVIWDGPLKESDASDQMNILNRHVAGQVSGIVLAPQHSKTMVPNVE